MFVLDLGRFEETVTDCEEDEAVEREEEDELEEA
jgi:hypothetical protein